jgi:hypothetical protein
MTRKTHTDYKNVRLAPDHRCNIKLESVEYGRLLEYKQQLERDLLHHNPKRDLTWSDFFEQMSLFMMADRYLPCVKALRFNRYAYFSLCPECGREKTPLLARSAVIWKVECPGCGTDYIAKI